MKRWMALITIAMFVAGIATPAMVDAAGGCSPNIKDSSNKTVSGTSGAITVAAAASSPAAAAIDPEIARKKAKIEWALKGISPAFASYGA